MVYSTGDDAGLYAGRFSILSLDDLESRVDDIGARVFTCGER